ILDGVDHGELLTIFGMFTAFITGALSFELVGLKPDLGALVIGMIMAGHPRSKELYERMMSYKDFFLTAFFINIGLSGIPGWGHLIAAIILILFVNLKGGMFLLLLSRFKIRARTSFLASIALGNYSEFALIIGVVGMEMGWISGDWILIMALAMSFSFLVASPLNIRVHDLFDFFKPWIIRFNRNVEYPDEEPSSLGQIKYLIIGMGETGQSAYNFLIEQHAGEVLGIDYDHDLVAKLNDVGINAEWGDATDSNLWENADVPNLRMVLFAMEDHHSNINSIKEIMKIRAFDFKIGVISHYPDEREDFEELNVDYIYDYRNRLGRDFVMGMIQHLE
ncbi:MAG: potassium transporter Kef, partial [Bacteroidia bacterium]